ncbi:hypothetical protein JB92DRAFT_1758532 [Gautieria morchelliformis]|nr:hypothetical protein JB92DRAFT_1758532 [Gautieria morchelliformis]
MASQQSVDIQVMSDNLAIIHVNIATLALLAYDTLLTLPSEITYIWRRRVRLGTVLYLLARYPAFLSFIMLVYIDIANIPLECVQPIGSSRVLSGHYGSSRYRRTLIGANIRHVPAQSRDAAHACSPRSSSIYGRFEYGSVYRYQRGMQCHGSGCGRYSFVTDTINNVSIILFDTLVVVVTLYNTLGLVRRSREFPMLPRKSLTQILAEQSLIRYGFVLTITLASLVTTKVLRPSVTGILITVQDSLSTIIICRCHLALQERVAHTNGITHSAHHPVTSFRAAARQIHDSLMEEFGDPSIEEIGTSEAIGPHREDDPLSNAVVGSELEEIPRGRGPASAIDGDVHAEPTCVAASAGEVSLEA